MEMPILEEGLWKLIEPLLLVVKPSVRRCCINRE
ncbi:MAG: hypothetical protein E5299_00738 [Burkholderia gladioli]|nr:MAG: hypothetical protein E5299_00738 [Burkholderia gladioli]